MKIGIQHLVCLFVMERRICQALVGPVAMGFTLALGAALAPAAPASQPNILIIVGDDVGYADVGFHGCKDIPTPNLDRLAAGGIRFTSGYVTGVFCGPTRGSLMTGRYLQRYGHDSLTPGPGGTQDLPLGQTTIADRFKAAGYATGLVGKWHLGELPQLHPQKRGFQEFFGFLGGGHSYFPARDRVDTILRGNQPIREEAYLTDALAREAIGFIERHKGQPWLLCLTFNAVHTPMQADAARLAKFAKIANPTRRTYAAMMSAMDDAVGAVMARLRGAGVEDNTLVFFFGDNGGPAFKPSAINGSINAPLRGSKGQLLEGGIRVPFVMQWKGRLPAGRTYELPVIQLDVQPTALAAAGIDSSGANFDGVNLLPHLTGQSSAAPHETLYWRFGGQMAIRRGDWKLVRYGYSLDFFPHETWPKLYNLAADVGEANDLAAKHPEKVKELEEAWRQWNAQLLPPLRGAAEANDLATKHPEKVKDLEEAWHAVEQPELKQALESAKVLPTESLGEPARGVNTWEHWLVPNPDGKTWDVLQLYFKEYYQSTWLHAIDLGTGQVKKQRLPDKRQFYLSGRALGFDGKYYITTPGPTGRKGPWGMFMHVYDPATNTLEDRGEIVPELSGEVRPLVTGPDGRIYGTGTRNNRVSLYIYDPKLGKVVKDFGPVGPGHANGAWSRYVMGVDDTHAYIVSGMIPWYLVAVNLKTGEDKVLLESPTECRMDIVESFPGAWVMVPQSGGSPTKRYWLYHGQAIPKVNDTPPWSKQASPWDKAGPKPELYRDQIDPDAEGNATLWYRLPKGAAKASKDPSPDAKPDDLGWRSVRVQGIDTYPHPIANLRLLPDGRLYGGAGGYQGAFIFDPKTDRATTIAGRQGLSPYTTIVCGDKLYLGGYSGGKLLVYDPKRAWTMDKAGPPGHPAPPERTPASNPRFLGAFDRATRVAVAHSSAVGADGRVYFGGFGKRDYTGGGFGWYDPKTEKLDGFWKPLSGYALYWLAPLQGGRLIVMSSATAQDELNENRVPAEAKLFVYDVNRAQIVRQIVPVPKARTTGLVTEVAPGRLLGLTVDPAHRKGSLLYGVDATTGEVLFRRALPWPVSADDLWPHWVSVARENLDLVRGPDGFVWTYLMNVLVRIDPQDARMHVVGKIEPPGRPTFVGNDLYFAGTEQLRRIRNIVPQSPRGVSQ